MPTSIARSKLFRQVLFATLLASPSAWSGSSYRANGPSVAFPVLNAIQADGPHVDVAPQLKTRIKPLHANADLALVPVTVTDTKSHPVANLQRENFAIYENGAQKRIEHFSSEDGPISIGLILDFSKSMTGKIETELAAVEDFFLNANREDDYFVVTVSARPRLVATSIQSISSIESALGQITPGGSTALLDAIYLGAAQMCHARYNRHALLIISDGGDNSSRYRLRETLAMIRESDIEVYAIGLFDTALFKTYEEYMGKKWLGEITDATGGRTLIVDRLSQLPDAAATISLELRSQYILGYRLAGIASHGEHRKIRVELTMSDNLPRLRTYYRRELYIPGR